MLALFFSSFSLFNGQGWEDLKPGLLCWKHQEQLVELKALGIGLIVLFLFSLLFYCSYSTYNHIFLSFLLPYNNPKSSPSFTYKQHLNTIYFSLFLLPYNPKSTLINTPPPTPTPPYPKKEKRHTYQNI